MRNEGEAIRYTDELAWSVAGELGGIHVLKVYTGSL